ncbi:MAG: ribosome assembly cofactor RimP, partial [Flavobacterium sp.]
MTFKEKVNTLITEALQDKPSIFLIDLSISDSFKISVGLDGDNGVALQDCIDISRAVENNLDREEQDFSLEVASVGVGSPLKMTRQYKKNIGRTLIVTTNSEKIEAELVEANDVFIILSWKAR